MAGTYGYKPPEKENAPGDQSTNGGIGKNRIYQVFKNTIELDELSLPSQPTPGTEKTEDAVSLQWPLIKINDFIPSVEEIRYLEINCDEFIPTIILKCTFLHQKFISTEMPKDGDIISIAIRNKSDLLKPIRNDYVITGVVSGENSTQVNNLINMTFFGVLFIPWISSSLFNFSFEGTSFEALKDVAKKIGLGFATNEDNTDDKQIWMNGFSSLGKYIQKTINRSWKDDTSFYDIWIDIYYNLNFVNVNKQLMSSEDEIDPAVWLNNIDKDFTFGANTEEDTTVNTPKVLSNYEGYRSSSFFINSWRPNNRSTKITFQIGTKLNCNLFEHNSKLYQNKDSEKYWSIPLEPTYDEQKINKYILLRGRATQDPDKRGDDLARANYSYPEMYVGNEWMGVQYTISNPEDDNLQWDGNHHKNYLRAEMQNLINNKELEKLNVEVSVNGLNLNIIKGDKTPIVLIQKDPVESQMINSAAEGRNYLEQFYSGWYYIKGFRIKYNQENAGSIMSNFTQTFTLTRREWPPPIAVESLKTNENNNV